MIGRIFGALANGASGAVAVRAASILASFLLTILVARLLGADAAGTYFLVFTSLAIMATLGRFGTDNLALKICGGASEHVRRDLIYSAILATATSLIAIAAVNLLVFLVDIQLPGIAAEWIVVVSTSVLPQVFTVLAGAVLRARGKLATGTLAELGSLPILATVFLLAIFFSDSLSTTTALLALTAASWLSAAWSVPSAVASLRGDMRLAAQGKHQSFSKFVGRYGRQLNSMMGTSLLFYVLTWAPIYALSITGSIVGVSYYTAAVRLANLMTIVPSLQVSYLAPAFARLFHLDRIDELNKLCARSVRQVAAVLLLPTLVLGLGSAPIVGLLYGADFSPAALPLSILAFGTYLVSLFGQFNQLMLLCNLEAQALVLNMVLVFAWATAGLWVASTLGIVGAAAFGIGVNLVYAVVASWMLKSRRNIGSRFTLGCGS